MPPQRILVVDDDADVAELVMLVLQREGLEVEAVHSGREALERLAAQSYDLIICDLVIPDINGIAVYQALQQRPEPQPRVLFLSSYFDAGGYEDYLKAAGVPILAKPFEVETLRAAVRAVLLVASPHNVNHPVDDRDNQEQVDQTPGDREYKPTDEPCDQQVNREQQIGREEHGVTGFGTL